MMKRLILSCLSLLCATLFGDFALDNVFSSNMVLQRQVPIAFWGTGTPGSSINATFMNKKATATIGEDGKWKISFPAAEADHVNYEASFTDGSKVIALKDILLGDVWFCSGQSNMEMPIGATFRRGWSAQNCEEEVKNANYPELRYARQKRAASHNRYQPANLDLGGWVKTSPQYAAQFSATAYFFGRKLLADTKVPIGLVVSPWSGSNIKPWISKEGYANAKLEPELSQIKMYDLPPEGLKALENTRKENFTKDATAWYAAMNEKHPEFTTVKEDWAQVELNTEDWQTSLPYKTNTYSVRWYRNTFKIQDNLKDGPFLTLMYPGAQVKVWLNGKLLDGYSIDNMNPNACVLYAALPENILKRNENNVLAIRAELPGADFKSSHDNNMTRINIRDKHKRISQALRENWLVKEECALNIDSAGVPAFPKMPDVSYKQSGFYSSMYNGQVEAWTHFPIKGIIWYQGCSNNGQLRYYQYHKALINDWRTKWNNPDLPFIIVQLAGYRATARHEWFDTNPTSIQGYALTRDIQLQMTKLNNVGLATAVDIGEPNNIHPANKQDVGLRLALEAERIAYGMNIVSHGPKFIKAQPEGNAIRVFFENGEGLHTTNGKAPAGFAVAGDDLNFVWAEAKIDGDTILVSSDKVAAPKFVRYAMVNYLQDLNLQNAANLPAYPFRSDEMNYDIP